MTFCPKHLNTRELLNIYGKILEELRERKILRTSNGPVGDYAEWLVAQKLNLTLATNTVNSRAKFTTHSRVMFTSHDRVDVYHQKTQN